MIFSIKFINLKLTEQTFDSIHKKIIEICNDCLVHDCNTEEGFTIQVKPINHEIKGRLEVKTTYDNLNTIIIEIEKEYQMSWSLEQMENLVKELQTYDQSLPKQ